MPSDPELVAETRSWLEKAYEDLEMAQMALIERLLSYPRPAFTFSNVRRNC